MIYKDNYESKKNKITYIVLIVSMLILFDYIIELVKLIQPNAQNFNPQKFIIFFNFVIAMLGTTSAILSYKGNKKEEVFIMAIMFSIFTVDIALVNIFQNVELIKLGINIYQDTYIAVGSCAIRSILCYLAITKENKLKNIIIDNKIKSIIVILSLTLLLAYIEYTNPWVYGNNILLKYVLFHISSFIINIYIGVKFMIKAIKQNEIIYSIIGSSVLMFAIHSIYSVAGRVYMSRTINLVGVSIIYFGFIIISIGLFIEFMQSKKKNDILAQELEIFYKIINDNEQSGIVMSNEKGEYVYANSKAIKHYLDIYGVNLNDIISKKIDEEVIIHNKKEWEEIRDRVKQELENNNKYSFESKIEDRYIECFVQEVKTQDKYYMVTSFRDVTSKHEMEKTILEYEKVKQQELIRNEFFANISHELKTPLNILYSTVQLLTHRCNEVNFKDIYLNHRRSLRVNCQRMLRLIDNIVDITKFETGYKTPEFKNYDIVRLVEEITLSVINYARRKNINIVFDTEIEELQIRCDQDMMERVMLNLLSNAIKFTNEGGNIEVYLKSDNDWVYISVIDDGVGIPKESQSHVFERFVQVDKTLRRKNEGSGIGLSLVKSIIDLNGGHIYLSSDGKSGTEFKVLLPNRVVKENNDKDTNINLDIQKIQLELSDIYELYGS